MEFLFSLFNQAHKTQRAEHPRPGRRVPKTQLEGDRRPRLISLVGLGSGVVTCDPTHSLGSGVVICDPVQSLGSGVVIPDPTQSLGSWVVANDPDNSHGSGVVTHDPSESLGSGVVACDGLGSGVGTHDPTHSLGSGVETHDPTHSLGSWVVANDPDNGHGSGVVTHDPSESLGSGVVARGPANRLESGIVTPDPTHSLGSGVTIRGSSGLGKRLYLRNTLGRTRRFYRNHSFHIPRGVNCVGGERLATVPRRARDIAREFIGGNAREEPHLQSSQGFPGNCATRVGLEAKPGPPWKVRMLSVRRPDSAENAAQLVATENQEPRLDTDRVAPNANGADRGRPSRFGARGQEETDSDDTDDSEPNIPELRNYSDDGAESELGEPEGHGCSRTDAASRGESRHFTYSPFYVICLFYCLRILRIFQNTYNT